MTIVHMMIVAGVYNQTKVRRALTRYPPKYLTNFYYQADKYLRLEYADAKRIEVNVVGGRII